MKKIIESMERGIIDHCTPNVAFGIIDRNNITTGAVGQMTYSNPEDKVTDETLYDIASLSKVVVTVTLVSKLLDKGIIKLSDPVQKYLPRFRFTDVSVGQLLTHTSGLPADFTGKEILPRKVVLEKLYNANKEYETGTRVVYSDLGYMFLGEIMETIYNKSLDEVARKEIFEPLNMTSTCYCPSDKDICVPTEVTEARGFIQGVVHDEKACSLGGVAGHAGVFTNAKDLSNFVSMILNDGMFNGKRFLSKAIIDVWFTPIIHEKREKVDRWRSWCWITGKNNLVSEKDLKNTISFNGFTGPSIFIDREKAIGIVLLDSRIHPTRDNAKFYPFRRKINDELYDELNRNILYEDTER